MNSQYPVHNSVISYNTLNPNPNFSNPQFNSWTPLPSISPQSQLQNAFADLPNSLSSLKNLLQSSDSTLQSLSSLLPPLSFSSNSLIQCPSNPHHWVPPNSLFLHSLHCPSSLEVGTLLDSLQYPKTLKSEQHLIQQNKFVQPLNGATSELCFSLDDYVNFGSNFFYQGCPGVVSSLNDDASRRIFTLPSILSVECANFTCSNVKDTNGTLEISSIKILPSEICAVRREFEFEQWSDFSNEYSYSVFKAFLCMKCVKESDLLTWLIANSPRFGVVIDTAMRDHMSVLVRLCFKAIAREAAYNYGSFLKSDVVDDGSRLDPKSLRFKCPVAFEVLRWLASQISILYGETNAKSFVIAMLGHVLLNAASHASLFPIDRKLDLIFASDQDRNVYMGQSSRDVNENKRDDGVDKRIFSRSIFVYQIAAAVAALHERSLLEERIRALRNPFSLTAYQRMTEHQYITKKADEERQKRRDYRSLVEHDSLPSQRQHDEQNMKIKTREELLAEERDYKRRRMSYRGKKLKRTTKEVMRDIIEDYMEAIKQTGGIGGIAKEDAEGAITTFKNSSAHDSANFDMADHSANDPQYGHRKSLDFNPESRDKKPIDASPSRNERGRRESYNHRHIEDKRAHKDKSLSDYHPRSPSVDRRSSRPREHRSRRRNLDVKQIDEDERSKSYNVEKSLYTTSSTLKSSSDRKNKRKLGYPDRHRWNKHESDERDKFNDRFDPSEASDTHDDQFMNSQSTRPDSEYNN